MSDTSAPEQLPLIPAFEARGVTGLEIAFGGKVELSATDPNDVEWFQRCKYGREVTFVVTGYVTNRAFKGKKETVDGETTGVADPVSTAKIEVHSIAVPPAELLEQFGEAMDELGVEFSLSRGTSVTEPE